jgi:hypothetical protein
MRRMRLAVVSKNEVKSEDGPRTYPTREVLPVVIRSNGSQGEVSSGSRRARSGTQKIVRTTQSFQGRASTAKAPRRAPTAHGTNVHGTRNAKMRAATRPILSRVQRRRAQPIAAVTRLARKTISSSSLTTDMATAAAIPVSPWVRTTSSVTAGSQLLKKRTRRAM